MNSKQDYMLQSRMPNGGIGYTDLKQNPNAHINTVHKDQSLGQMVLPSNQQKLVDATNRSNTASLPKSQEDFDNLNNNIEKSYQAADANQYLMNAMAKLEIPFSKVQSLNEPGVLGEISNSLEETQHIKAGLNSLSA